ncbi:MAG TPA: hypothetical protein VKZ60_14585 [Chloroflexota bacterium]|jgi:hypothetical protein|nr:hypothetical protein [Chloroflexota bacterium]
MQGDAWDDFLFFLMLCEGGACLLATYSIILLVLYGAPAARRWPCLLIFLSAALALVVTSAVADLRAGRRARRHY